MTIVQNFDARNYMCWAWSSHNKPLSGRYNTIKGLAENSGIACLCPPTHPGTTFPAPGPRTSYTLLLLRPNLYTRKHMSGPGPGHHGLLHQAQEFCFRNTACRGPLLRHLYTTLGQHSRHYSSIITASWSRPIYKAPRNFVLVDYPIHFPTTT